jgi:hypothetical protein
MPDESEALKKIIDEVALLISTTTPLPEKPFAEMSGPLAKGCALGAGPTPEAREFAA